jgi:protein phosphatase
MHYFVGVSDGNVAIFQGVQQSIGPISLSHVYQTTSISVDDLPLYQRDAVEATISADTLRDAHEIVDRLSASAGD